MPYMYILKCTDGSYYTGSTWDLMRRVNQHNTGEEANYTAKRIPLELVYYEYSDSIKAAFKREKQVQGWSRKKKEALINSDWKRIQELAECRNESHCKNAAVGTKKSIQ